MERTFVFGGDPGKGELISIGASLKTIGWKPTLDRMKEELERLYPVEGVEMIRWVTEISKTGKFINEDLYY